MRALFALVEGMRVRMRYLEQTVAVALAAVAFKLLLEKVVSISPFVSLASILTILAFGVAASVWADRGRASTAQAQAAQDATRR